MKHLKYCLNVNGYAMCTQSLMIEWALFIFHKIAEKFIFEEVNFSVEEELEIILIKKFDVECRILQQRISWLNKWVGARNRWNSQDSFRTWKCCDSRKKGQIVGDLIKGSSGHFAKTIFHFLCVMCEPWKYMPSWSLREKGQLKQWARTASRVSRGTTGQF